jgi:endonuclease/exonuclease/phosphatase family metal-dependent hydrolase
VVLVGDLNSTTSATSYAALTANGFVDVWGTLHPGANGFTCCEALPSIDNSIPSLSDRIDYVLTRGPFEAEGIELLGALSSSRTASGLWPSDHAGLVAKLRLPPALLQPAVASASR